MLRYVISVLVIFLIALGCSASDREHIPFVELKDLRAKALDFQGSKITVVGYIAGDGMFVVFEDLESWLTLSIQSAGVKVDLPNSKGAELNGCYVSITGMYKRIYEGKDVYWLTEVENVSRLGRSYFYAKEQLKKQGKSHAPKCEGQSIVEMMMAKNT